MTGYARISEHLLNDLTVSHGAVRLFGILCRFAREQRHCYPSMKTLADKLGAHKATVRRWLTELERADYITRKQPGAGSSTAVYLVHEKGFPPPNSIDTGGNTDARGGSTSARGGSMGVGGVVAPVRGGGSTSARHKYRNEVETLKENEQVPHISQTPSGHRDPQQEYDSLYAKVTKEGRDVDHAPISQRDFLALNKLSVNYVADVVLWCRWLDPEWGGKDFRKSEHKRAAYSLRTLFDRWADIKADYQSSQDKHKGTPWSTNGHATRDHERAEQERRRQELRDQIARREAMTPDEREAERERIAAMRSQYGFLREPDQQED